LDESEKWKEHKITRTSRRKGDLRLHGLTSRKQNRSQVRIRKVSQETNSRVKIRKTPGKRKRSKRARAS